MVKRETMGSRLRKARLDLGLSQAQLKQKILKEYRAEIGESTIRDLEMDRPPNPGVKTVELVCLGLGLPPLDIIGMLLDEPPPESLSGFTESRFATLWQVYSQAPPHKRTLYEELVKMLIDRMNKP